MGITYRITKNYTLPISAVVFVLAIIGLLLGLNLVSALNLETGNELRRLTDESWWLMISLISGFAALVSGWYVAEGLWNRRKFERLLNTDKRSEFVGSRKDLEELARRLPESYKPRIKEKEAQFISSKRA